MTISLLVLSILPVQVWMMLFPDKARKFVSSMLTDENIVLCSIFRFFIALLVLSFAGLNFELKWENTLSYLGLIIFLKGLVGLFFPDFVKSVAKKIMASSFQGAVFFSILVDAALIYIDTKLI